MGRVPIARRFERGKALESAGRKISGFRLREHAQRGRALPDSMTHRKRAHRKHQHQATRATTVHSSRDLRRRRRPPPTPGRTDSTNRGSKGTLRAGPVRPSHNPAFRTRGFVPARVLAPRTSSLTSPTGERFEENQPWEGALLGIQTRNVRRVYRAGGHVRRIRVNLASKDCGTPGVALASRGERSPDPRLPPQPRP